MFTHSLKITGASAVVSLASGSPALAGQTATTPISAKWVQVTTPPANTGNVLVGGSEVSSSVGLPIPPGWAGDFLPPLAEFAAFYDLSQINAYVASGDVLTVIYG
jgi:hypothetical protein